MQIISGPLLLLGYAAISASGLYLIKVSGFALSLRFFCGLSLYLLGFLIWLAILRIYPLSFAFPLAAGSLVVATCLFGVFFLNESIGLLGLVGIFLIVAGITLVSYRGA